MILLIHTDGGSRGNPGPAAIGVVIEKTVDGISSPLTSYGQQIGFTTNNVAEYMAVISALEWTLKNIPGTDLCINFQLDSLLVVSQLNGRYRVKDPKMRDLLLKVRMLEQQIRGRITYAHIRREENAEADKQVNLALDSSL